MEVVQFFADFAVRNRSSCLTPASRCLVLLCVAVAQGFGLCSTRADGSIALPVITAHPLSQTVTPGSTATFSVTATSGTPFRYQWRFNGADIPQATNSVHAVASAQAQNAGYYVAVVQNNAGASPSLPAFLSLEYTNGGT